MPLVLSRSTLASLPATLRRPDYDPGALSVGIVHLGLGAFHRAHQAVYTDSILREDPRWGICGVSLKTPGTSSALAIQDGLYAVLEKGGGETSVRVIGALAETLFLGAAPERVIARIADPAVAVVTLTVTEKGYCVDPTTGRLDFAHPEIAHDLAHPHAPASAIGLLVAGLAARRIGGSGPVSVVCCDNLPHNGRMLEDLVIGFATSRDPSLADWIATHATFPSTMVDRIVPATTAADVAEAAHVLGVFDAAPVVAEPCSSWVIEDRFAAARPRWEAAGAQVVSDTTPYETMKLRLLNGSHSTLAYLGFLAGHETIWQASGDPLLATLIERMIEEEILPTLVAPPGVDLHGYCGELVARFRNPSLPHRTEQVAMDGSKKLAPRLLDTVRDRIKAGGSISHLALAIAGWIRYASGTDEHGEPVAVRDPLAPQFAVIAAEAHGNAAMIADGFLDLTAVFGADLSHNETFRRAVSRDVGALIRDGVRLTLAVHLAQRAM
jgi:fructuronate reductase